MKQNRLMHFQIGMIIALIVALVCVNFTTDIYERDEAVYDMEISEDIPVVRTPADLKPKITPPPVIETDPENLIEEEIEFEEEPEPVIEPTPNPVKDTKPTLSDAKPPKRVVAPVSSTPAPPVIVPEAVEKPDDNNTIIGIAEKMPLFKMLKDKKASKNELKKHAERELIGYISKNVKYPAIARENGIEGTVVVRFVVEKNGEVSGIEVLRDPGGGLGKEAKRVVESMPKWERVGRQNGRRVRVYFTMPIKFELDKK